MKLDENEALWLPNGSVRAILALLLVLGCVILLLCKIEVPGWLVAVASGAVSFYFAANQAKDIASEQKNDDSKITQLPR